MPLDAGWLCGEKSIYGESISARPPANEFTPFQITTFYAKIQPERIRMINDVVHSVELRSKIMTGGKARPARTLVQERKGSISGMFSEVMGRRRAAQALPGRRAGSERSIILQSRRAANRADLWRGIAFGAFVRQLRSRSMALCRVVAQIALQAGQFGLAVAGSQDTVVADLVEARRQNVL